MHWLRAFLLDTVSTVRVALLLITTACSISVSAQSTATRVLDDFADIAPWQPGASDGVRASIRPAEGVNGAALGLDFDLAGTAGYALAARALPLELPANYEISFYLRADALINNFQVKLIDGTGENVWWLNRPNFNFPREWQRVTIKKRQIDFAWGPTKDRVLTHAARLEFVVAAGRDGGGGSLYISHLELRERPVAPTTWPTPSVNASSYLADAAPSLVADGQLATTWKSDPAKGAEQYLIVDFGQPREFGGLILRWQQHAFASRYDVQFSDDGNAWRTVRSVVDARGGPDALLLPDAETRYVRLLFHQGPARAYALAELEIHDLAFGASPNAFFEALARESPRGYFPRGFSGEQAYWTIVGIDGGSDTGLLSEDGALEVAKSGFSIEPFVRTESNVVTWADVHPEQSLLDNYLPIPSVTWRRPEWTLRVTSFASGTRAQSRLFARYEIRNLTGKPLPLELVLAIRPSQVNPPAQFLNAPGGVSPIRDIAWDGAALTINGDRKVFALAPPRHVGAFAFDSGPIAKRLSESSWSGVNDVHDTFGYASAALGYPLMLGPNATTAIVLAMPLSGATVPPALNGSSPQTWVMREQERVAMLWRGKLNRVAVAAPAAQVLCDTLRTALAHLLITRDGPILRPGTRAYARSWIRDGAMMGESLLRLGHADVAADYLRWYAPHQFANGKVPCCVDERGADPVPENDSVGEFVFLADEIFRYTGDRALLTDMWPRVRSAMRYLEQLRQSERTEVKRTQANAVFYGLLPASISHEGYSEKPMHSYWDDFWALKGYTAAIRIATALDESAQANDWRRDRDEFRHDLAASLLASTAAHRIDYIPGAAELGDFDPTSSTIAFTPGGDLQPVPPQLIRPTFERYWREFIERRDGHKAWDDYTPYELRTVGTFVRLGWRERANELLAFFMADRRPAAWNQWAEVVGRDPRKTRFVGDMPHGWIASDFIRAALDLFAYERDTDNALVLAAGVPPTWLDGAGITLKRLRTPYGQLSYSLRKLNGRVLLHVDGGMQIPAGGIAFTWSDVDPPGATRINGKPAAWRGGELPITEFPANVVINLRSPTTRVVNNK
ncbi:MAG TPA: discoidin domain-containing protein [Casimicrobiaceae bacterium]|jgi:hypothetical protein